MFAPISRTFEKPYPPRAEKTPIPVYRRNEMVLPLNIEENLSYYARWREVFSGDAFIYDYHLGRAHYGDLGYMTIAHTLYEDLLQMKVLGFAGMVACQEVRVMMPNAFPIYLMGRALWGSRESYDQIKRSFFEGLYGENAPLAMAYFDEVSSLCDTDYTNANGPRLRRDLTPRYLRVAGLSSQLAAQLESMPASRQDPLLARLLSTARQNEAYATALAALTEGNEDASSQAFSEYCRIIRDREDHFQPDFDVYRAITVARQFTGLKEQSPGTCR